MQVVGFTMSLATCTSFSFHTRRRSWHTVIKELDDLHIKLVRFFHFEEVSILFIKSNYELVMMYLYMSSSKQSVSFYFCRESMNSNRGSAAFTSSILHQKQSKRI